MLGLVAVLTLVQVPTHVQVPTPPRTSHADVPAPAVGWTWLVRPMALNQRLTSGPFKGVASGIRFRFEASGDDVELNLELPPDMEFGAQDHDFQVVEVDSDGQRREHAYRWASPFDDDHGNRGTRVHFTVRGAASSVATGRVGVEMLTPDGRREASQHAVDEAQAAGEPIAPLLEAGCQVDFELTCMDGRVVRSSELHGRVVLIFSWATWCKQCMDAVKDIEKHYAKFHEQGFEILSLNLDDEPDKARETIAARGLNWMHVLVPAERDQRKRWIAATGTTTLPRLVLLDRMGVVRYDIPPPKLLKKLLALLKEPDPREAPRPASAPLTAP